MAIDTISDVPLAVLVALNGEERVWALSQVPPPYELLVPRKVPTTVLASKTAPVYLPNPRRFKLHVGLRSPAHRWWNVYNEGRSQTPEDGFVYLEERTNGD